MIQKGREKLLLAPATTGNFRSNNMRRLCAHDNQPSLALVGIFVMKYIILWYWKYDIYMANIFFEEKYDF